VRVEVNFLRREHSFEKHLLEQGNEVEEQARRLFPDAVLVTATGEEACEETRRLMAGGTNAIFQATFLADGFFLRNGTWSSAVRCLALGMSLKSRALIRRKGGNEDRDHISDLTFQEHVLELASVAVGRTCIVRLNKEYVRTGPLDVQALFIIDDSSK
jgi:hypothetical protein